jgi:hypothetical protein
MRTICEPETSSAFLGSTYLDRAKDPENQGLHDGQGGSANADYEVDADVFANIRVAADLGVFFGPFLEPYTSTCVVSSQVSEFVSQEVMLYWHVCGFSCLKGGVLSRRLGVGKTRGSLCVGLVVPLPSGYSDLEERKTTHQFPPSGRRQG